MVKKKKKKYACDENEYNNDGSLADTPAMARVKTLMTVILRVVPWYHSEGEMDTKVIHIMKLLMTIYDEAAAEKMTLNVELRKYNKRRC